MRCEELCSLGIEVVCIKCSEIAKFVNTVDYVLAIDEDERRALCTLYGWLMDCGKIFIKIQTYIQYRSGLKFYERIDTELESLGSYLLDMQSKGIQIFNLIFEHDECYKNMAEKIRFKWIGIREIPYGLVLPIMYKKFFGNRYLEADAEQIAHLYQKIAVNGTSRRLKDCNSPFFNVNAGERYTVDQPLAYKKTIYFVGPCFVYGARVEDKNTIESFLQKKINTAGYKVKVVNYGSPSHNNNISMQITCILDMPLIKGDIVVLYAYDKKIGDITEINLTDALKGNDVAPDWMIDNPKHCNDKMNSRYADIIFEKIKPFLTQEVSESGERIEFEGDAIKKVYLDRYFSEFTPSKYNKIGSIVMNCNPFTYGHRYLIEQALNTVDFLIIFVVEEDRSVFTFDERFVMVCEGVADLNNVMVVPSGPFILSQTTFPEYFIKTADEDLVENVENDITLFAEKIAPQLNIKYRFVGEEPEDAVTNEYNLAMKRILPKNGIELVEIPRKERNGKYISASSVRKCLEDNNMAELEKLVPKSTMRVLFGEM